MPVELVVPSVGESITEVEIGDWLKKQGEAVNQDDPVVVIETEKVTVELPAPASGTITSVLKNKGDKASVGDVIGYIETNGAKPRPEAKAEVDKPEVLESKAPPTTARRSNTGREEQAVPMTPIRRRIAERLVEAQ